MGWIAITKDYKILREEDDIGRPVAAGNDGELLVVAQEDFGRKVAIDLVNGVIAIDYDSLDIVEGNIQLIGGLFLIICEETNIVGEYKHLEQRLDPFVDEETGEQKIDQGTQELVFTRTDLLTPLTWRPIWFTRWTNTTPTKVIGAQVTTPELQGSRNVKKMISIFDNGALGID